MPKSRNVHQTFAHASMQFSDSDVQMAHDARAIFDRAVVRDLGWVTGTEAGAGAGPLRSLLRTEATAHKYRFWMNPSTDSWFAVNKALITRGWETFAGPIIIPGKAKSHTAKRVTSVAFYSDRFESWVTVIAAHYLTKGRPDAKSVEYRQNVEENRALAEAIGEHAAERRAQGHLIFYGGDQNIVDRTGDTFFGEDFVTCWDALKKWPTTGHGNIDVLAYYDDERIEWTGARAFPDADFPLHTDHFYIEATARVSAAAEPPAPTPEPVVDPRLVEAQALLTKAAAWRAAHDRAADAAAIRKALALLPTK